MAAGPGRRRACCGLWPPARRLLRPGTCRATMRPASAYPTPMTAPATAALGRLGHILRLQPFRVIYTLKACNLLVH
jgi:hypothetical protein